MRISDKTYVVTGAGSGIGRELALALLTRGARVAAVDLSETGLEETRELADAGDRISLHVLNITDRGGCSTLVEDVCEHHGRVDGLINNAGVIQPFVPFAELDYDAIDRMIQVNLYGTIHMTKAFLPHLLERPEAHLVNVSSMGGFMPFPGQTMYGVAKAGVKLLSEGLYAELADTAVEVSVVMPGAVATNISTNSGVEMNIEADEAGSSMKPLPAPEAARVILNGMERGQLHILVGRDAKMLSLASRVAPAASIRFIQRQMKKMMEG